MFVSVTALAGPHTRTLSSAGGFADKLGSIVERVFLVFFGCFLRLMVDLTISDQLPLLEDYYVNNSWYKDVGRFDPPKFGSTVNIPDSGKRTTTTANDSIKDQANSWLSNT